MRLKSLELQGFKSFPDRTKIRFDDGMTVVIGPNGSGKSNIADAIRWVLGELSSKNIRGTKMEDVIFAGTDGRRPMGYAEVSLTFDNSGPDPLPLEYDEVTVTRKYYRSGDSEYLINGQRVRLRDITELFMNTGLGKSGYSIIGQGRIAEIISKKSEDRRGIFEEAAGISKFRAKKSEAERKLEKVDENLSRATDILSELETRVGPLEKDAEKARRYLELYEEKRRVDVGLWLYEIDSIRSRSAKLEESYEIAKHELELADDALSGLDRQTERLLQQIRENQEKSESARRESARLNEEKHAAAAEALLLDKDVAHMASEQTRLGVQIEEKTSEGKDAVGRLSELQKDEASQKDALAAAETALESAQSAIGSLRAQIEESEGARLSFEESLEEEREGLQQLKLEQSSLESSKQSEAERKEELDLRAEELAGRIRVSGEALLKSEKTLADYRARIEESKAALETLDSAAKALEETLSARTREENALSVQISTVSERISLLARMEEHFEGFAGSVRYVMNRAADASLSGILGPVSSLIKTGERYAQALEVALGAALQYIVTDDEDAAKRAIEDLKRAKSGRATFYPISNARPQYPDWRVKDLESAPGYLRAANELVTCSDRVRPVIDALLCRTIVCDTLEHASALARRLGYRYRIVSLDGQVVNPGGSLTGGSMKKDAGILTRKAEIARLEAESQELLARRAALNEEIAALNKESESGAKERESAGQTLEILNVMFSTESTEQKIRSARLAEDEKTHAQVLAALESLQAQMSAFDKTKEALLARIAEKEAELERKKEEGGRLSALRRQLEEKRVAAIDKKNSLLFEKGALEKDLASTRREIERTLAQISSLQAQIAALNEEKETLEKRKAACRKEKAEMEQKAAAYGKQLEQLEQRDETLRKENEEFEKRSEAIRRQQKDKTRHREILLKEYTRLEGAMESIKSEQERYTSRLWDEYELTYAAAKDLGCPEVREETRSSALSQQNRLRARIRELGSVNVGAIEEYAEVKQRYDFLKKQYTDLTASRTELSAVISGLEKDMKEKFSSVFSAINDNFRVVFAELFGGGTAELSLSDPENVLESGIEIAVAPPGKIIKSLSLLSGGEQVFVAIALFFAILRVNPAPFCLLDEIEAALDEVNVARFAAYAKNYSDKSQFIIISHRRGTMEMADTMYGVTMEQRGVSKILPLHLNEVEAKSGIEG